MLPGVAVGEALLAGAIAGLVMIHLGYWIDGFLGMPKIDLSLAAARYLGRSPDAFTWSAGMILHFINSAVLGLLYAAAFYPNMPIEDPTWWHGILFGLAFGVGLYLFLPVIIMGTLSRGQSLRTPPKERMARVLLTLAYGVVLGAVYFPFG